MVPPFVKHALANELEPRRELEGGVFEHGLEVLLANVTRVTRFVGVDVQINVGLDKQDVID